MPIPSGWEDRTQLILVADGSGDFRPNIVVTRAPLAVRTMERFLNQHQKALDDAYEGFEVRASAPVVIGPHHGHLLDYDFTAAGKMYRQRQFMVVVQEIFYTFTHSHLGEKFEAGLPAMERIVGAAKILEPFSDEFLG